MVPPQIRQQPHVSFTQLDAYLRCPLRYRFTYVDRIPPDFVPAALAFGSGIHGAVGYFYRQAQKGQAPGRDHPVEATRLQLSIYSYATAMNGLADQEDLRLRFDVLTKTKKPELHRYWTTRDRAANLRLFRLVSEVLRAIEAGVFHPVVGWHCQDCPYRSRCWAWGDFSVAPERSKT
jgi:hypothetical protein